VRPKLSMEQLLSRWKVTQVGECLLPLKPRGSRSRKALEEHAGPPPHPKCVAMHICEHDSNHGGCVNGAHLRWGTVKENTNDLRNYPERYAQAISKRKENAMKQRLKRISPTFYKYNDPHPRPSPLPPGRL